MMPDGNGRAVFLDRDGTINEDVRYLSRPEHFRLLPGAGEAIRLFNEAGWIVVVVTNQSAIARGLLDEPTLGLIHRRMVHELAAAGARVDAIFYCPHHPDDGCDCRKPRVGLIRQAQQRFDLDLSACWVVGDMPSDVELGRRAGCRTALVLGRMDADRVSDQPPTVLASDLLGAARHILAAETPVEERLRGTVGRFDGRRILVVGDLMLDEWVWGRVNRISPEAPIPVVDVQSVTYTPGGACNVATNLVALGGRPVLLGVVGDDDAGRRLCDELARRQVSPDRVVVDGGRPTTLKTRIVAHSQQMVRADRESRRPVDGALRQRLVDGVLGALADVQVVLLSDYAKGVLAAEVVAAVVGASRQAGVPVVVDPKGSDYSRYRGASVITPNQHEAAQASRIDLDGEEALHAAGRRLLETVDCAAVLITRGEDGMALFEREGRVTMLPTYAREVYDVTGAGDTAVATLALALAAGADHVEAAKLANHAAGVVVGKVGTATLSQTELLDSLGRVR
ncbi:MAG: D-glycero-beta-D-manno-heptose-7-phosphate kinase [Chloroflexi bacterium]|nr:D-glycero-beta-D-manno-heptose-7-phosphate kinase [Chloroflexota bacterium]